MKKLAILLIILFPLLALAQSNAETFVIEYKTGEKTMKVFYQNEILFMSKANDKIKHYSNIREKKNISVIKQEDSLYKLSIAFEDLPKPLKLEKKSDEKILGFKCKYAQYSYFSNTIEVWFTEKSKAKGSPYSRFLPSVNALVLKLKVNGSDRITAKSISKIDTNIFEYIADNAKEVSDARFEELKINSRFTIINIFDNEQINWDPSIEIPKIDALKTDVVYHLRNGTVLLKKIRLTKELKSNNQVFAKLNCRSNGDAYDRTGSVFIFPASDNLSTLNTYFQGVDILPSYISNDSSNYYGITTDGNYEPSIEVMRFFTSFGASYFNDKRPINNYPWAKDVIYKQEISSLIPNTEDEIWVGVYIGNYDKGGHKVSLEFDIYPDYENTISHKAYVKSLFSTVNVIQPSGKNYGRIFKTDTLEIDFSVPENVDDLKFLFTTTGHGGWGEGDEFVPRLNQVILDGKPLFTITPWRTDCATYRFSNPASGNFGNGLSSSDLSRSNWCPATLTPPYVIPLDKLKSGNHKMRIIIDFGPETDSGRNSWNVSGILTGKTTNKN